jgi:hypothetical protein
MILALAAAYFFSTALFLLLTSFTFVTAGFFLKTHDFLQPLEKPAAASVPNRQQQHALPGGIGTFTVSQQVPGAGARPVPPAAAVVVKPEQPPFVLWGQPTAAQPISAQPGMQLLVLYQLALRRWPRAAVLCTRQKKVVVDAASRPSLCFACFPVAVDRRRRAERTQARTRTCITVDHVGFPLYHVVTAQSSATYRPLL